MKRVSLIALIGLVACGGGGSGGSSSSIPGIWDTRALLIKDDCRIAGGIGQTISPTYQVNQNGSAVVTENLASKQTSTGGTTDNERGFVTTSSVRLPECGAFGALTGQIEFGNISGNTADYAHTISGVCGSLNNTCETVYAGTATKR